MNVRVSMENIVLVGQQNFLQPTGKGVDRRSEWAVMDPRTGAPGDTSKLTFACTLTTHVELKLWSRDMLQHRQQPVLDSSLV